MKSKNAKPFWRYVKSKKQDNVGIAPLRMNGNLHTDSLSKANILNKQFQSVFTQDDGTNPSLEGNSAAPPLPPLIITIGGVEKLLANLKTNSASGPDNIPNRFLKEMAKELAPALTHIFRQSVSSGDLPLDWRCANIAPIFKKGDKHQASNYRPISLTSVCSKLLEHIICKHIRDHLEKSNALSPVQHGFRKGHSTESQLIITLHDLTSNWDNKSQTDLIILDFSKAFDTVPHDKLLSKLVH